MQVVHLTTIDQSGAGRAAMRIVRALKQYGTDARLLCLFRRVLDNPDTAQYSIPRSSLWCRLCKKLHLCLSADQKRYRAFSKYIVKDGVHFLTSDSKVENDVVVQQADILHLHWVDQFVDLSAFFSKTKQPIVWTLHDMGAFSGICNYSNCCSRYKERCGKCPAIASLDDNDISRKVWSDKNDEYQTNLHRLFIVTCSHWLADCARQSSLFRDANIRVIPNCIDTNIYKPFSKQRNDNIIRVMLGAVNAKDPNKGYERLVRLVDRYAIEKKQHIEVLVVGHASDDLQFHSNVSVKSFGFVEEDEDLVAIYNQADLLLYGSYRDNLPNMIMEAMACGIPVISFSIGGIPDLISHKTTGYLAQSEDDYLIGMDYCLSHRRELGENARKKVLKNYSMHVVADMYNQLYQEIL